MPRQCAKLRIQGVVAFAIAAAIAVPAGAIPGDGSTAAGPAAAGIEEILVTAQRREESLQKTSVAMQVVSAAQLKDAGIKEIADLETTVPGLQIAAGGAIPQVYIRGVGDFGATPITNPAVAMNADGIYLAQAQSVAGGLFDIARVEVLKGPQGTLYGRNASGGAINFISSKPDLDHFGGYGDVEVGNLGLASIEGALNLPISSQFALRLAGQDTSRKGYLTQGLDDDHHQSARLQALWKTDTMSLLLATDYSHAGGVGQGQALLPSSAAGTNSPWVSGSDPGAANYYYTAAAAQGLCVPAAFFPGFSHPGACPSVAPYPSPPFPPGLAGPYTSLVQYPNDNASQDNSFWRYHAEFNADLGGATLTVLPAYQTASLNYTFLPGGLDYHTSEQSHATSVEARLSGTTPSLKWVVGAYYFDQQQQSDELVSAGLLQNNNPVTDQSTRSNAMFGELTFSIAEATRLIAGARYTTDKKGIDGAVTAIPPNVDLLPPSPLNKCFAALPNPCLLETYTGSATFDKFTWKVGIEQDLTAKNMLYGTVSTGFKAGGFDQSATSTPGSTEAQSFNPENLTAFELGSRNRFLDERLQVNAEAFYWLYKDHQEPHVTIDGQGQIAFDYVNAGDAKLYGFDLDAVFKASDVDTLHAGVEYLHSRYDTFEYDVPPNANGGPFARGAGNGFTSFDPLSPLAANTGCATSTIAAGTLAGGVHVDCSGFALTHAPTWSGSVDYSHRFPLSNGDDVTASIDGRFASSRWLAADFTPIEDAPGYFTENASVTYNGNGDRWALSLWGRNLSNKAIYNGAFQSSFVAGFVNASIEPPRTYGARISVKF